MFKPVVGVCSICLIGLPLKVSGKETIVPVFDKPYKTNDILATDFIETYSSTFDLRHKSSFAAYTSGECVRYHTNCEAAGYFTMNQGRYCTTSEPSVSIYISNCSQTPCYEDCPTDVSTSCADFEDTPNSNPSQNNLYCKTTRTYYLDDGSGDELICGGDCVPAYEDCEDAGYVTKNENKYCPEPSESLTIYLLDGTRTDCYEECHIVYTSCEDAGLVEKGTGETCTGAQTIYTSTSGATQTCYNYCTVVNETCEDYGYLTEDPTRRCESCVSLHVTTVSGEILNCFKEDCEVDASCCDEAASLLSVDTCGASCRSCMCQYYDLNREEEYRACAGYQYKDCWCS